MHFAAESHVDRSILGAADFVMTNVVGTQTLLDAALRARRRAGSCTSPPTRSTARSTTGSLDRGRSRCEPNSPYSASKAVQRPARARLPPHPRPAGRASPAARTTTGPTSSRRRSSRCSSPTCSTAARSRSTATARNVRDWLHVDDHCRGIQLVLAKGRAGRGLQHRRRHRADQQGAHRAAAGGLRRRLGQGRAGRPTAWATTGATRSTSPRSRDELGYQPAGAFEQGLAETVAWYRDNRDWWEPLKARARHPRLRLTRREAGEEVPDLVVARQQPARSASARVGAAASLSDSSGSSGSRRGRWSASRCRAPGRAGARRARGRARRARSTGTGSSVVLERHERVAEALGDVDAPARFSSSSRTRPSWPNVGEPTRMSTTTSSSAPGGR